MITIETLAGHSDMTMMIMIGILAGRSVMTMMTMVAPIEDLNAIQTAWKQARRLQLATEANPATTLERYRVLI